MTTSAFAEWTFVCPSVEHLKTYKLELSLPIGYSPSDKSIKLMMLAAPKGNEKKSKVFLVYPYKVPTTDTPEVAMASLLDSLQQETAEPLHYKITDKHALEICTYSVVGQKSVNALVYFDPYKTPFFKENLLKSVFK
jgi:hypothetical protein